MLSEVTIGKETYLVQIDKYQRHMEYLQHQK